jgi:hypothetical protein
MARVVTASCPSCGAKLKLPRDKEFVTCDFCGAESLIERPTATKKAAPEESINTQHIIYVPEAESGGPGLGTVLYLLFIMGVIGFFISKEYPQMFDETPLAETLGVEAVNYQDGSQDIRAAFEADLGPDLRVTSVVIYPEYVVVDTLRTNSNTPVQSYALRKDGLEDPRTKSVGMSELEGLSQKSFAMADIDFGLVPKLLAETEKESGIRELTHQYLVINKVHEGKAPLWIVFVGSEGRHFYCTYGFDGARQDCN